MLKSTGTRCSICRQNHAVMMQRQTACQKWGGGGLGLHEVGGYYIHSEYIWHRLLVFFMTTSNCGGGSAPPYQKVGGLKPPLPPQVVCPCDGMGNKEQHEGKGKGWACNNHNMHNPIKMMQGGVTHVMIVACPSLAFAFLLLLISHAFLTGFACIYCILFLYLLALAFLHPLTF